MINPEIDNKPRKLYGKSTTLLTNPAFWQQLVSDVQQVPSETLLDTFLRRFDPTFEGNMGPSYHHGHYYNLSRVLARIGKTEKVGAVLVSYRPPVNTSIETIQLNLLLKNLDNSIRLN